MTRLIPCMMRWPLRLGAAAAAGTVILATAVPGAFGEVGTSGKDQAQQALKHVQANSAAIHHASDQAKGLTGKANAAAQHARDAADKAAKLADQVSKDAGVYATTYVEVAGAVALVNADAATAESAATSAQAGADSAAAAADQLLQYSSLVNDAVQQTNADVKTADQDTTAVSDAMNQAAVSDQWATDSATQLATVQTSYATATQSQTDATAAQQTTQTDATSSTTLIRAAYRTSGAGLTPIAISSGSGGSTGDTSGSTGGGSTGGSGGAPASGAGNPAPPGHVQPPAHSGGIVVVARPASPVRDSTSGYVPSVVTPWQTLTRVLAVTTVKSSHGGVRARSTAVRPATAGTTTRGVERMAPIRRQTAQADPAGILDTPIAVTDFGAVPLLTVLLLVEALILGRRIAARRRRGRRSGLAMT